MYDSYIINVAFSLFVSQVYIDFVKLVSHHVYPLYVRLEFIYWYSSGDYL